MERDQVPNIYFDWSKFPKPEHASRAKPNSIFGLMQGNQNKSDRDEGNCHFEEADEGIRQVQSERIEAHFLKQMK